RRRRESDLPPLRLFALLGGRATIVRMKLLCCLFALAILGSPLPGADPALTKEQRAHAIDLLERSRKEFLAAVEGLTDAQWNYKPAPERWSVGEVAEHIMLAEGRLFARMQQAISAPPN